MSNVQDKQYHESPHRKVALKETRNIGRPHLLRASI